MLIKYYLYRKLNVANHLIINRGLTFPHKSITTIITRFYPNRLKRHREYNGGVSLQGTKEKNKEINNSLKTTDEEKSILLLSVQDAIFRTAHEFLESHPCLQSVQRNVPDDMRCDIYRLCKNANLDIDTVFIDTKPLNNVTGIIDTHRPNYKGEERRGIEIDKTQGSSFENRTEKECEKDGLRNSENLLSQYTERVILLRTIADTIENIIVIRQEISMATEHRARLSFLPSQNTYQRSIEMFSFIAIGITGVFTVTVHPVFAFGLVLTYMTYYKATGANRTRQRAIEQIEDINDEISNMVFTVSRQMDLLEDLLPVVKKKDG